MNNKLINNKQKIKVLRMNFLLKKIKKEIGIYLNFRSGTDPESRSGSSFPRSGSADPDQNDPHSTTLLTSNMI